MGIKSSTFVLCAERSAPSRVCDIKERLLQRQHASINQVLAEAKVFQAHCKRVMAEISSPALQDSVN